jgi:hypothetical protein
MRSLSSFGSTEFVLWSENMRVRILKPSAGIMDGVSLSHLLSGLTYDVEPSLGHYLTLNQYAEEVPSEMPALVIPVDDPRAFNDLAGGVSIVHVRDQAADKPRRARQKKR